MLLRATWRPLRLLGGTAAASVGAVGACLYGADAEYRSIDESALPTVYDPEALTDIWVRHPRCALRRVGEIGVRSVPFLSKVVADYAVRRFLSPDEDVAAREARHAARAVELRLLLTELGPTFIKFGQMLSIRPDVMPPVVVHELQKLCDSVPSYPTDEALRLIEAELGRPASDVFDGLDEGTRPIAAASLGQVYRCTLRESGEEVALKVQRPDVIRAVSLDLYLMRNYMRAVEWFKVAVLTRMLGAAERTPFDVNLLDTFARASYLELDYRAEARNLQRFTDELVPRMGGAIYVPRWYARASTRKVLTTEWIEGEQVTPAPRARPRPCGLWSPA